MSTNQAAWLMEAKAHPLSIKPTELWEPEANEILVENKAVAINPLDISLQTKAMFPLQYPAVLGHDVAGYVAAVGSNVTRVKQGDRVVGFAVGIGSKRENAFQSFTILQQQVTSPIPDSLAFEQAAVIPLGLATAACGLFQDAPFLGLQLPTAPRQAPTGKTILIWGGSSSVGSNGIQLAVAAGYEVIATASPKNFDLVKSLGASQVFDYNSPTITDDLINAFKGKDCAGALDCIGGQAAIVCVEVVHKVAGKGCIATTKGGADVLPDGISISRIFATTLKDNKVGKAVFEDFLPKALKAGTFVAAPSPEVVGKGLEAIQGALDIAAKGVSAKKIVVTL